MTGHRPWSTAGRGVNMTCTPRSIYQERNMAAIIMYIVEEGSVSNQNTVIEGGYVLVLLVFLFVSLLVCSSVRRIS